MERNSVCGVQDHRFILAILMQNPKAACACRRRQTQSPTLDSCKTTRDVFVQCPRGRAGPCPDFGKICKGVAVDEMGVCAELLQLVILG